MFTACVGQNSLSVKKEKVMEKENIIDVSQMPIQTYEEYTKVNKFMLEKYIVQDKYKNYFYADGSTVGVAYLKDGTRIAYSFSKEYISEELTNKKHPFKRVIKSYYINNKSIKDYNEAIANLFINKMIYYNSFGEIVESYDYDVEYQRKGINYTRILDWADAEEIIDFEESRMLKGNSFALSLQTFEKFWNNKWGLNNEEFRKKNNLTKEEQEDFFKHKYYWVFDIDYLEGYQKHYLFGANGKFIMYLGRSEKLR